MYPLFYLSLITLLLYEWCSTLEISESTGGRVECAKSKIDHNVTLASGHHAGSFLKANKSITHMHNCVKQCCQMKGCDVALFHNSACYSVKCKSLESCAPAKNTDKRTSISISFVAKPKLKSSSSDVKTDGEGEPALEDNLIAEVTQESPFTIDDKSIFSENNSQQDSNRELLRTRRESWRETKDMFIAISCGFLAVTVGVIGVITMTRQLIEDDDEFIVLSDEKMDLVENVEEIEVSNKTNKVIDLDSVQSVK